MEFLTGTSSMQKAERKFSLSPPLTTETDNSAMTATSSSDFNQWLHAMKMVAVLPGGMPPEFRKKLWLTLADKYLQTRNVNWKKEQEKCFSEEWREDDEELGIQIVKDLHRTGSSLCSGPTGAINQAKLKRILLGYARWNPEVGYCQGFNMLGALILQVMDKNEIESMKVMIFLVEGVLPPGYFSGSLSGLQADMEVFREIMTSKLPTLAKHLQKLQEAIGEGSFEPPLTNVFTMQWFLTLFCTCLPISCVLRVWDLTLIEGSDVLLRTALAIWGLLEDKIISAKTADDFYCKMGTLSGALLNGHLIDSNGLIDKVAKLGPIPELQKLREKHLHNVAPWKHEKGLRLLYSDEEGDSDDESSMVVSSGWGLRSSSGLPLSNKLTVNNKDRLTLDISLLKNQYDRLRERQRQAHIILTTAVARQSVSRTQIPTIQMNQLLIGRNAIITNKGRRIGPPQGAIPPARKLNTIKKLQTKQLKIKTETPQTRDSELKSISRDSSNSTSGRSSKTESTDSGSSFSGSSYKNTPTKIRKRSESSSCSEDSDGDNDSSTSTSLCDDDENESICSSLEASPIRKMKTPKNEVPVDDNLENVQKYVETIEEFTNNKNTFEILDRSEINQTHLIELADIAIRAHETDLIDNLCEHDQNNDNEIRFKQDINEIFPKTIDCCPIICKIDDNKITDVIMEEESFDMPSSMNSSMIEKNLNCLDISPSQLTITSTSQLSPIADISKYLSTSSISPLKTPSTYFEYSDMISTATTEKNLKHDEDDLFDVSEEGVTNKYFERVNVVERPRNLDLKHSLNNDQSIRTKLTEDDDDDDDTKIVYPNFKIDTETPLHINNNNQILEKNILPSTCTNLSTIIPKKSFIRPLKTNVKSLPHQIGIPLSSTCRASSSSDLISHNLVVKEKSFSFDEQPTINIDIQNVRPKSCPESGGGGGGSAGSSREEKKSDRILKIIEENSMILHRILQNKITDKNDIDISEESPCKMIEQKQDDKLNFIANNDVIKAIENITSKEDEMKSSQQTRNFDITNTTLRTDENITDRLASIQNTIKSIDTLCNHGSSYKGERLQKYIDSLFENVNNISRHSTPSIQIHETKDTRRTSKDTESRFSRGTKRDLSPRLKRDENNEENASRLRRNVDLKFIDEKINDPLSVVETSNKFEKSEITEGETFKHNFLDNNIYDEMKRDKSSSREKMILDDSLSKSPNRNSNELDEKLLSNYEPSKIEIRHTTVTSTFYDRYLSQQRERNAKRDKSPLSPVITKAYLDSLKPTMITTTDHSHRSGENSPP